MCANAPQQIHDCLLPQACKRTPAQQQDLLNMAEAWRLKNTSSFTAAEVNKYTKAMCAQGYEGMCVCVLTAGVCAC